MLCCSSYITWGAVKVQALVFLLASGMVPPRSPLSSSSGSATISVVLQTPLTRQPQSLCQACHSCVHRIRLSLGCMPFPTQALGPYSARTGMQCSHPKQTFAQHLVHLAQRCPPGLWLGRWWGSQFIYDRRQQPKCACMHPIKVLTQLFSKIPMTSELDEVNTLDNQRSKARERHCYTEILSAQGLLEL